MTTYRAQLKDDNGNTVYPDVGLNLDDVLYGTDPGTIETPTPWVTQDDIVMSSLNFGNYSTTEKDTGFTWIDGRHIYKKTVYFGAGPNAGEKTVAHGISNLDNIIKFEGFGKRSGPNYFPIQFTNTTAANQIYMFADNTNITLGSGINRSTIDCYVTLYYIKTS